MKTLIYCAVLVLSGCSSYYTSSGTGKPVAKGVVVRPADQITVTEEDAKQPHRVLGDIEVTVRKTTIFNADPTHEDVNKALREKAHELGADAVVLVRYGTVGMSVISWGALEGKGRAIAYQR